MVFSSSEFLFLFLPILLFALVLLPFKNATLLIFSLFFYFFGEGWFVAVMLASIGLNYVFGLLIGSADQDLRSKWLFTGVALNLVLLFVFKYIGFFSANLFNVGADHWSQSIRLPLGISFFSFQAISYLVDVYRGDTKPERSLLNLAVCISMFPHLIAGPIVRFASLSNQLRRRVVSVLHIYYGVVFFCIGLGQKVLIADTMASVTDPLFAAWQTLSSAAAWLAALSYTVQIYFDFAGYSNMAIGLGYLLGFQFPQNFNYPYISQSITEFWRRWHMSLSSWFRDYLYISLGGNRMGPAKTYRNLLIVFFLCGLWHGAAWTFVLWGLYHGALLVVERVGFGDLLRKLPQIFRHGYTLTAVLVGWVFFRADTFEQAVTMLKTMFLFVPGGETSIWEQGTHGAFLTLVMAAFLSTPVLEKMLNNVVALPVLKPWPRPGLRFTYVMGSAISVLIFLAASMKVLAGFYSPFIYFRF